MGRGDGRDSDPDPDSDADQVETGTSASGRSDHGASRSEAADRAAARRRHPTARRPAQRSVMQSPLFVGLAFLVAVFNLLGLVMVLSASSVHAHTEYGSSWYFVSRQALWTAAGAVALVLVARLDYHRLRRWASPMLLISLVTLVLVVIPGVGVEVHGASRWLGTGTFSVQPSEFAKLALLIWTADLLARRASMVRRLQASLVPVLVALGAVAGLIMLQPNLGTTIVVVGMILGVCFVAGVPMAPMAWVGGVLAALVTVLAVIEPYRRSRLVGFWDPWDDPLGEGYQSIQSMVGLASGGVAGTGLGASRAKWGFLPFAHTDFIFAIIGEELGLIGALMVVALFVLLGVLGVRTALHASDRFGMLLAVGVTAWFLLQAFINIGAVIGVLPVTGVPLPFVSSGGSSLVVNMVGVGLLLSVARQAVLPARRTAGDSPENVQRDGGHE